MPNAKIYVNHHAAEKYPLFESDTVIPILAGNPGRDGYRIALRDTVGLMNCCKAQVEEIIFAELIMI